MKILRLVLTIASLLLPALPAAAESVLAQLLPEQDAAELVPGADGFGPIRADLAVAPVLKGGETVADAFVTSDFVGTTGYSGKPIHTLVALDEDAKVAGVRLVKHSEPIVLIGIPEAKVKALVEGYRGLDLVAEAQSGGTAHEVEIISGATVTVMVIDDSIVRSGLKVARALGLGGLAPETVAAGPKFEIDPEAVPPADWHEMEGDGTLRRLSLDVGQVNAAFAANPDARAAERALTQAPETTFIEMQAGLVSVPAIGGALLGPAQDANLKSWLAPGDQAIAVMGRGLYSFKGSGYVRGGIFDRIVLIQDDVSVRFRDRDHRRMNAIAAEGAPEFTEMDLFKIPAASGFDPAKPFRIQLLVQREVGPIEKVFHTFDLGYQLPQKYLRSIAPAPEAAAPAAQADESQAQAQLWKRIWLDSKPKIAGLAAMLLVLTGVFFFQSFTTRYERAFYVFRMAYLTVTLVFLGWYANAQLSVVNLMALFGSLVNGFSWQAFLLDPLTFILWFAVAAALLFWGRGAYCGWLCPFGALQELTNQVARKLRIPQWTLPWGLHERLWPVKYMIFLGLFGVSLMSVEQAEHLAEVEPFKTAIILKFIRAWPFVAYAAALLIAGLFVERFYCRYLCPLGAALAIPARMRMFDWLKRYHECGNPCQTCARQCPVQSIHPTGEINPNECINCLHCQVLYQSETTCPVVIKKLKRREAVAAGSMPKLGQPPAGHPNAARKIEA
ncbi:NosR/NirI family protein [Paracoccus denitrificans]|jgi:NosR/NirI family nitrous oxide reductase transcriptional regulator|uniref:FMN-binding domain protein n=1 Tax=Paracoccus denitrificans (strain Pd 1222) TaxID=318586 RepID=A1B9U0_PARDP|nr:NosR/NirI family protein [Paracoccus denitrificans]ABL72284.1 FMN-binding domain protein [Paracoccus denitrificans PD1222]MBB4629264.1 NosR/NirI family nitrous oxide reductase transcriptional regulator [Paracoccus denitrificans]MCU7430284.1 NosR/NirI family protein [Paracoccus denitrificans]QAR28855.1 regulatory protein NosR [Paracoccus denitrificans]UPV97004.1 NosR/NirI family protein [Paracoccus denitrificans]